MQALNYYDFDISANSTQILTVEGSYLRIQESTGALDVTVEGVGTIPNMLAGQGLKDTKFNRLVLRNVTSTRNYGKILVGSREFVDNRTYGVNSLDQATVNLLRYPLTYTASKYFSVGSETKNIIPGSSNINGLIIVIANFSYSVSEDNPLAFWQIGFVANKEGSDADSYEPFFIIEKNKIGTGFMDIGYPVYIKPGLGVYALSPRGVLHGYIRWLLL